MSKMSMDINWNSAKEEFLKVGVTEKGFEFLKELCHKTEITGGDDDFDSMALKVIQYSKGLEIAPDDSSDGLGSSWDYEGDKKDQKSVIKFLLEELGRKNSTSQLSDAVRILSTALCEPENKLNGLAKNMTSNVQAEVVMVEGNSRDW